MKLCTNIKLTAEQSAHVMTAKSTIHVSRRLNKFTGYDKVKIFNQLDSLPKEQTKDLVRCAWCNSIKLFSFDFDVIANTVWLINIKYSTEAKTCARKDNDITKNCEYRKLNPNSVDFVFIAYNFSSKEEAHQHLLNRNKSPFYKHNHSTRGDYAEYQRRDVDFFGSQERYEKYVKRISLKNSKEYVIENFGIKEWEKRCKSKDSMSVEFHREKYGEYWESHYNKRCQSVSSNLEQCINRYGKEQGIEFYNELIVNNRTRLKDRLDKMSPEERKFNFDTVSKDYFKRVYGDDWVEPYKQRQINSTVPVGRASKESLKFFNLLLVKIQRLDLKYYIGDGESKEYFLWCSESHRIRLFDFTLPDLRVIIEFNGSMFHYNPNYDYSKRDLPFGQTIEEARDNDKRKQQLAEHNDFEYFVVFDTDDYNSKAEELANVIINKHEKLNLGNNT